MRVDGAVLQKSKDRTGENTDVKKWVGGDHDTRGMVDGRKWKADVKKEDPSFV